MDTNGLLGLHGAGGAGGGRVFDFRRRRVAVLESSHAALSEARVSQCRQPRSRTAVGTRSRRCGFVLLVAHGGVGRPGPEPRLRPRTEAAEHAPAEGPAILASN